MNGKTLSAAIKLLIFAVVTILATAVLGVVITNRTFGKTTTYHAVISDVTDLTSGNDVRMAGVRIGTVSSIKVVPVLFDGGKADQAEVSFTVDQDVPLSTSTRVEVHYLNLVGQRYLDLIESPGSGAPLASGAVIGCSGYVETAATGRICVRNAAASTLTAPAVDLTALFNGFRPLFQALTPADVNAFSLEIVRTLQGEGGTIDSLLSQTASLTRTVANRDSVIGQVVDNLLTVLNTVEKRNSGLSETITQLQRLVTGLAGDRGTIAASISHIDDLATNSTSLIKGVRPYLPADLTSLERIARTLNTTKDANGQNTFTGILEREPAKLNRIIRTTTYGGYFNFWLCNLDVAGLPFNLGPATVTAPSCPVAS